MEEHVALDSKKQNKFVKSLKGIKKLMKVIFQFLLPLYRLYFFCFLHYTYILSGNWCLTRETTKRKEIHQRWKN